VTAPAATARERLAWLYAFWRPHWRFALGLLLFTLLSSALAITYPLMFREAIDAIEDGTLVERILSIEGLFALILLGRLVVGFYPGFRAWMNNIIEKAVRERVFGSILEKDHTFFGRFRTGDLVTRLTDDIADYPRIAWFGCSGLFRFFESASKFVFVVAAMLLLDWQLALMAMAPVPVMLWVFYLARRELGSTYERQQEAVSETNDVIESAYSGIRIVKAFNADRGQERRLAGILDRRVGIQLKLAKLVVLVHEMDHIVARIGQVIVLAVGGGKVIDGTLSLGTLMALYVYLDMLLWPMMDLPNLFVTAKQAFVSIDREREVLGHPAFERTGAEGDDPGPLASLELDRVGFRYRDDGPAALEDVSFRVPRGRTVALVGPVGCGKTTLLRLLAGLLPAQRGSLNVNDRPLGSWDWRALRPRIGYVPQESLLFSETLQENVAFGREADAAWVRRCLEVAQMGPDLERMPDGLETDIGRRGTLVSGGQKQRIAIARALAGRPDLLLLDDCTASLDAQNEDRFWAELRAVSPETTVFLISHRLATIRRADTILVLEGGRLVAEGTHEELAQDCKAYRAFLLTEARRAHLETPTEGGEDT
jgi:ATP-binding cassette subfamily B protein